MVDTTDAGAGGPAGATVLLVEDEEPVRNVLARMLVDEGYTVLTSRRPDEALETAAAHAGEIQLLVTDMVLPGMNGVDLATRISEVRPSMRLLFISGYPGEAMLVEPLKKRGAAFLHKPFPKSRFLETVRSLLGSSS